MMFRAMEMISDGSAVNIGSGVLTCFLEVACIFADIANYSPLIKPEVDKPVGVQNRYADTTLLSQRFRWRTCISIAEGFARIYESARRRIIHNELFRISYEDCHSHYYN
jgi:UDP-glucose 4-epimerase